MNDHPLLMIITWRLAPNSTKALVYNFWIQGESFSILFYSGLNPLFHCLPLWKTVRLHVKKLKNATNEIITYHEIFFVGSCMAPLCTQHIFYQATVCFQIDVEEMGSLGIINLYLCPSSNTSAASSITVGLVCVWDYCHWALCWNWIPQRANSH